jgi:uncharacterized protein (TIGR02284 family)
MYVRDDSPLDARLAAHLGLLIQMNLDSRDSLRRLSEVGTALEPAALRALANERGAQASELQRFVTPSLPLPAELLATLGEARLRWDQTLAQAEQNDATRFARRLEQAEAILRRAYAAAFSEASTQAINEMLQRHYARLRVAAARLSEPDASKSVA